MIPIVTPVEMAAIDARASEPVDVLIRRAAWAVARQAVELMGGTYGRRVLVLAGKGNNGSDGRVAADILARRGVRVRVVDVADLSDPSEFERSVQSCDLLVDAAFGTGFRGTWEPPRPGGVPVLAVDIPSGIDGLTGAACGSPWQATRTVTFAALKPGLLQGEGSQYSGDVVVADIGLDVSAARTHLVEDGDVAAWVPDRARSDHKWTHAVRIVAGSPGMEGAGWLCARAAMRGGAGYVRSSSPGVEYPDIPREAVGTGLPATGWGAEVASGSHRFGAVVVGPGIGRGPGVRDELADLCGSGVRVVLDADALAALGTQPLPALSGGTPPNGTPPDGVSESGTGGGPLAVLTPHDGEYETIMGERPGPDRLAAARSAAQRHGAIVLLKGPTTVVAHPDGPAMVVTSGDERLATAGSGDVLSGLIGAYLATGADPFEAASAAAHLHGVAARLAGRSGIVAGDIAEALGAARTATRRADGG